MKKRKKNNKSVKSKRKKTLSKSMRKNKRKMETVKATVKLRDINSFKPEDKADILAVQSVLAGNKEAYGRILQRYRPHLVQRFFKKLNDRVLAEDLAAEVLGKVYEKLDKYQPTFTFNSWFYVIADRFLIDWSRKQEWKFKQNSVSIDNVRSDGEGVETTFAENLADPTVTTDGSTLTGERMKALKEAMATLDDLGRQLVTMFYDKEMRYEEIADAMGMNTNTMKVQLMRAKKKIGEYIKRAYPEFEMRAFEPAPSKNYRSETIVVDGEEHTIYSV